MVVVAAGKGSLELLLLLLLLLHDAPLERLRMLDSIVHGCGCLGALV
jgi:hypothetical protein